MKTLANEVVVQGVGIHTGEKVEVRLCPAELGQGLNLTRTDVKNGRFVRLTPFLSVPSPLCTLLRNENGVTVSTVEHLLAALAGLGVTDANILIDGPEMPIGDGSAQLWVEALDAAGRVTMGMANSMAMPLTMGADELTISGDGRTLTARPADAWHVDVTVDFDHPLIGRQHMAGVVAEAWFREEIARARTFTLEREVVALQAAGFGKGGGLHCAVIFGDDGTVLNPEGLRWPDEPVRHKVLDVIGDFYLAGRPLHAALTLVAPGHSANNALLRKMVAL